MLKIFKKEVGNLLEKSAKGWGRLFIKDNIQVSNKFMKNFTSLSEMKIKVAVAHHTETERDR